MQIFTITRGHKPNVDACINDLQAMNLLMNNEGQPTYTQLGVRPVQLWEFSFPEQYLEHMLATMNYRDNDPNMYGLNSKFAVLRKMLKLKKIPKLDYSNIKRQLIRKEHVAFHHIGYKEDNFNENGTELL